MSNATEREAAAKRRLDEHIKRTVDAAPPLDSAQRDRLSLILNQAVENTVKSWPAPSAGQLDRLALLLRAGLPDELDPHGDGEALDEMLGGK